MSLPKKKMLQRLTLAKFLSSIFFCEMCVVCSRPMKIDTFLQKNDDLSPNWLLTFFVKKHIPKNHGNRRGFRRTKLQQQLQTLEIVQDFAREAKKPEIFHFSIFIFLHFFIWLHFYFIFS